MAVAHLSSVGKGRGGTLVSSSSSRVTSSIALSFTCPASASSLLLITITIALIGYRIHKTISRLPSRIAAGASGAAPTSGEGSRWGVAVNSSQKTFEHIMVMIIESAAAYSVILIIYAVFAVVPSFNSTDRPEFFAGDYIEVLTNLTAGTLLRYSSRGSR